MEGNLKLVYKKKGAVRQWFDHKIQNGRFGLAYCGELLLWKVKCGWKVIGKYHYGELRLDKVTLNEWFEYYDDLYLGWNSVGALTSWRRAWKEIFAVLDDPYIK